MSAKTTATGHAINLANFKLIITHCDVLGPTYNPANPHITLPFLHHQAENATILAENLNTYLAIYSLAIDEQEIAFKSLSAYTTRIYNAAKAAGISRHDLQNMKTITRKLQGIRAVPKKKKPDNQQDTDQQAHHYISVSQMSYNNRIMNFGRLLSYLESLPQYTSNEQDLSIAGIQAAHQHLINTNTNVTQAHADLKAARNQRNKALYEPITGICDTVATVKSYILALFGQKSPEYKTINKIRFKKPYNK